MANKSTKNDNKQDAFLLTDSEVEFAIYLSNKRVQGGEITRRYRDWESISSKYGDILELYKQQYPAIEDESSTPAEDFPQNVEEVSKQILSTKLKNIRLK